MDHKTFSAFTLKADQQQGVVESIVAVMGNSDQGDDIIHNGAFLKTITERRGKIRVLDQHQTDSIMRAIGKPLEMRELNREQLPPALLSQYPSATGGLYAKTQYLMDTPEGKGAFQRIAAGAVDEYSIGYDPLDVDYSKIKAADGSEKTVRNLRTIKLYEYSPVLFGMNDATQTLSAKGATGAAGLPLADRERAWDSAGAEGRVRTWAGAADAPNEKYKDAFFWYDSDEPDDAASYKLQFADVIDGKLTAIPRGIFAVAAVLQGSRGGVDIPAGDKETVKSKVSTYYKRMAKEFDDASIIAPWDSKSRKDAKPWNVFHEGDKWNVYKLDADGKPTGDALGSFDTETEAQAQMRALYANEGKSFKSVDLTTYIEEVTEAFNEQYGTDTMAPSTPMSMYECFCIYRVYDDHVIVCELMSDDYYSIDYAVVNGEYQFAAQDAWVEGTLEFVPDLTDTGEMKLRGEKNAAPAMNATQAFRIKSGRVLAARNETRLRDALKLITEALAELDKTDMTDEAPAPKRAANPDAPAQAGPTSTSPTQETLRASIEIELAELKLMEV